MTTPGRQPARQPSNTDEADLLARVADGDEQAFERLYMIYHRRLSRFLMRFSNHYSFAEDVINDTLYIVWNKAGDFVGRSTVSTWITGIAYRRALKALEAGRTRQTREADASWQQHVLSGDAVAGVDDVAVQDDWLRRGLDRLPVEQRMALELAYFMGHSCEEIAEIAQCPVNTVKTRLFHARRRLREALPALSDPEGRH